MAPSQHIRLRAHHQLLQRCRDERLLTLLRFFLICPLPPVPADILLDEERYATQLEQLEGMGFSNRPQMIRALKATNGNVNTAVDRLIDGQFQD